MKRTPLYEEHVKLGGKMVEFAGWEMPVQYSGVVQEHNAVRNAVGLFDVSHMGEIWFTGAEAEKALDAMTCNRVSSLVDGKAQYSAILNERGGVVDDIIIYRVSSERFLVCVNASNADKDFEWFKKHNPTSTEIVNASSDYGQIAVQGPAAIELMNILVPSGAVGGLKYFGFAELSIAGVPTIVARTGYTGEDGVEIFVPSAKTADIWRLLLDSGKRQGVLPCGLGARDSLRLEAALPLHGHELGDDVTALESGLGWIVKLDKGDFIGRDALAAQKNAGVPRKLVGFELDEPGIARHGDTVADSAGHRIGTITSGTKTPTLNKAIGLAIVDMQHGAVGTKLSAVVRGRAIAGHVIPLPFYKRPVPLNNRVTAAG